MFQKHFALLVRFYCWKFDITFTVTLYCSASSWHCFEVRCVALIMIISRFCTSASIGPVIGLSDCALVFLTFRSYIFTYKEELAETKEEDLKMVFSI